MGKRYTDGLELERELTCVDLAPLYGGGDGGGSLMEPIRASRLVRSGEKLGLPYASVPLRTLTVLACVCVRDSSKNIKTDGAHWFAYYYRHQQALSGFRSKLEGRGKCEKEKAARERKQSA